MAEIEIKDGKLFVNGLPLAREGKLSSTGKSILLVSQTVKVMDGGDEVKVQVTAYKKA